MLAGGIADVGNVGMGGIGADHDHATTTGVPRLLAYSASIWASARTLIA